MDNEITNLLPQERQRTLSREYILRLSTVSALLATVLAVVAGLLLLPTYVFLTQSAATKQAHLASIQSVLSASNEIELSARLAALSNAATILAALGRAPLASTVLRATLAVPHPGVKLSGLTYTPAASDSHGTIAISGVAATREALRTYQLALQSDPFASVADVPVSAYAKDADIGFVITVTLAP